ncbi:MAG: hypothetical protein CLLPBCKN_000474 [Chroococcidiopsis cubana SAG 39.79]|jgi:hypothetical protein|uniref:Uncharacterized protein n=1 Tax=Chroococcidiopsis cubana SAG 39.79 TaxID=388085 RepID=A0AB37UPB6_9CYAN|nr:hypothetical protein [Chroococcidiopsis cubana]MDZ4871086.1 hypothetical protein [Chroococcidiopsis cubana SAG 39.79]PSB64103.1 hypothetical protein C7B79_11115 [Chroococcidiopsis cubana CCALA 043]RUT13136.1 hypothetical protein DSM107010_16920 [Chroococcidiopsis cubana SAG 39.79]
MHEAAISTRILEQHALKLQEHGLKVEEWGKRLQERSDQLALEHGLLIEECGQVIQHKAEEALVYTQVAMELEDYSSALMMLIAHTQSEARAAFIQAITIFAQMMQKRIKLVGKHL